MAAQRQYVLGLDLGSSSIGWACLDEVQGELIDCGVRIFPEGVKRDTIGGELSKNEDRRIARGMRRQIARRARRKKRLREALAIVGLLPTDPAAQSELNGLNPYELRCRALDEPLTLHEIGRVFIHLCQRRGFLSNRKSDKDDKDQSETLKSISDLADRIETAGHQTLGEHLAIAHRDRPLERLRGQHTRRDMYETEFDKIWDEQSKHHPKVLTTALKYGARGKQPYPRKPERLGRTTEEMLREVGIYGLLFFQRSMYWPKSVVGQCELDPKQKRCPKADRLAQYFRILQEVNNLRIVPQSAPARDLTAVEREKTLELLMEKADVKFNELKKELKLLDGDGFNLERGDRGKLLGMETDAKLSRDGTKKKPEQKLFGKDWYKLNDQRRNEIVQSLIHDEEHEFRAKAESQWQLAPDLVDKLCKVSLPEGHASYGRQTIVKLLPYLEQGLPLLSRDGAPCAVRLAGYLPPWERSRKQGTFLAAPPEVTNPLVRQALFELRKVLNAIVREYGKPAAIHIEMIREVKATARQREQRTKEMRGREKTRDAVRARLAELGLPPTRSNIQRYLLWEEQDNQCLYSGRPICVAQLFGGEVDIDHILPYSRSLDDSYLNKAVCFRSENQAKGNQTVQEWLANDRDKLDGVLHRAAKLPLDVRYAKREKINRVSCELDDFIQRQLSDTSYIACAVKAYVETLGVRVVGAKGQLTAELRHAWGLNTVLRSDNLNLKNRDDHRHHAVDAIVIALTNQSRLQSLARSGRGQAIATPWASFRQDVETKINGIYVSHRVRRKVAGALHEETIYGPTEKPGQFVYRKPLEALTPAMLEDIRDPTIRALVQRRVLETSGIKPGDKGKIPKETWQEPLTMKSGVVIKKVRLLKTEGTIRPLGKTGKCVKTGSNHHVCIFELEGKKGKKRVTDFVAMLEASRRVRDGEPIIKKTHPEHADAVFLMSLSPGECVLADVAGVLRLLLYRTGKSTEGRLTFVDHADSRKDDDVEKLTRTANSLMFSKVTVDPLGRLRRARD